MRGRTTASLMIMAATMAGLTVADPPDGRAASAVETVPARVRTIGSRVGVAHSPFLYLDRRGLDHALDKVVALGTKWIRVDFPWSVIQRDGPRRFDWSRTDLLARSANAHGLRLLAVLTYSPEWARPAHVSDHYAPNDPADFARFAAAVAYRYGRRNVHAYEIWNEPNLKGFWGREPNVAEYSRLLRLAYRAIHRHDSAAVVVSGGLSPALDLPGSISPFWFTVGMYATGANRSFDAVGMHPYSFPLSATTVGSWNVFHIQPQIHEVMTAFGDGDKQIWGTEIGWPTGTAPRSVAESIQGDRLVEAIRAWQRYSFSGPLFIFQFRDSGPNRADEYENMGIYRRNTRAKPAVRALRTALRLSR